ncbi:MAG TPA: hypothetical protein VIC84_17965 [Blastocatellia bacterium]|jgi:hypothetical protein
MRQRKARGIGASALLRNGGRNEQRGDEIGERVEPEDPSQPSSATGGPATAGPATASTSAAAREYESA